MHDMVKAKIEEYKKAIAEIDKEEKAAYEVEKQLFLMCEGLFERKECDTDTPGAKAVWDPVLQKYVAYSTESTINVSDEEYEELKRLKAELEEESAKRNEYKKTSSVKALSKSIDIDTFLASNSDNYNTANKLKSVASSIKTAGIIFTLVFAVAAIILIACGDEYASWGVSCIYYAFITCSAFYMAYLLLSALAEITHSTQRSADILYFTAKKEEQKEDKTEE